MRLLSSIGLKRGNIDGYGINNAVNDSINALQYQYQHVFRRYIYYEYVNVYMHGIIFHLYTVSINSMNTT